MILIADSGSTKTSWCFSEKGKEPEQFNTGGVNPFFRTTENIVTEWKETPMASLSGKIDRVFFYGAGVVNEEKALVIKKALNVFFPKAEKEVHSDLLAAAHATLGNKSGIACILGTGSNSCLYDGKKLSPMFRRWDLSWETKAAVRFWAGNWWVTTSKKQCPRNCSNCFSKNIPWNTPNF
jgi:glucosamine kinase